jgi:hypothetical protein
VSSSAQARKVLGRTIAAAAWLWRIPGRRVQRHLLDNARAAEAVSATPASLNRLACGRLPAGLAVPWTAPRPRNWRPQ